MKIEIWEILEEHPNYRSKLIDTTEAEDLLAGVHLARAKYPEKHLRVRGDGKALVEIENGGDLTGEAEAMLLKAINEANEG